MKLGMVDYILNRTSHDNFDRSSTMWVVSVHKRRKYLSLLFFFVAFSVTHQHKSWLNLWL